MKGFLSSRRGILVLLILGLLGIPTLVVGAKAARRGLAKAVAWQGLRMNRGAWEAGFSERGLPVPAAGPRDGYWGARIGLSKEDAETGWILPALSYPGLLEVQADGSQVVRSGNTTEAGLNILVLGGSTAFGAYASDIAHTYFALLSRRLAQGGIPNTVTVRATGAWKSSQELASLKRSLASEGGTLDAVLFLNGLNDLTNGSNANSWYGIQTETLDGSTWHPLYHEGDLEARVRLYLENMQQALMMSRAAGVRMTVALQPALFEKSPLSRRERSLEKGGLRPIGSRETLQASYESMREGLREMAAAYEDLTFMDCSRIFDKEPATTFTDLWHFSDPGHEAVAECLLPAFNGLSLVGKPETEGGAG